nr:DUF1735 domain-containing protein [uncultured Draconibacterium sp.]
MIEMKTLYKNILYASILTFCTIVFYACDKDETYDFPGDEYNRVYILDKASTYKIIQTPISTISNIDFKTTLKCTQKATESIKATVKVDNSMIEAYNEKNETKYEAIPTSAVVLKNTTMTIPQGEMVSIDTLSFELTDDNTMLASLKSQNGYLIPLRIATTEGGDSQVSTNVYTTYVVVTVTEDNINHDAEESDITGTLVADQSNWTASTNGSVSSWGNPLSAIFDGDMSSSCTIFEGNDGNPRLDIDMGKQYTFDAITFYYGYDYGDWGKYEYASLISGMTIYTSDNGTDWRSVGKITSSSKYCMFYAPITCRHIRLVSSVPYMEGGIFNIYQK